MLDYSEDMAADYRARCINIFGRSELSKKILRVLKR